MVRIPVNSRPLVLKFWGSQIIGGFSSVWEIGTPDPSIVPESSVYTLRLYFVLNSIFVVVELTTLLQLKRKVKCH